MAKPIRALELHYPMIQFLIIGFVVTDPFLYRSLLKYLIHYLECITKRRLSCVRPKVQSDGSPLAPLSVAL